MAISTRDFHEDAVHSILLKLPVQSLIRFKFVCKSWYALFEDSMFISKHLKNYENTRLIVIYSIVDETDPFEYPLEMFHLYLDETLADLSSLILDPLMPVYGTAGGPYDGIFCIFGVDDRLTLWNPATKESRPVPKCRIIFPRYTKIFRTNFGFGRDLKNNEYKFVLIFTLWDEKHNDLYDFSQTAVYTLSTNSWRYFESFKSSHYHMPWDYDCINLDGDCYWLLELRSNGRRVVLSFDLSDEVYQEIQGPCLPQSVNAVLGLYDECISLLVLHTLESCFEIWTMKDNKWTKKLTFGPLAGTSKPLGFWKNGNIFVETNYDQIILYDPSTEEMKTFGLNSHCFQVRNYTETLIPIKGDDSFSGFFEIPWHILGVY
nr:SLF5 protein [Citrus maxima]